MCLLIIVCIANVSKAQIKFGNNLGNLNPSAILEMESTNRGLLIPRIALMSTAASFPLQSHVAGMLIYNTATAGVSPNNVIPGIYLNNGAKWDLVTTKTPSNVVNVDGLASSLASPNSFSGASFSPNEPNNLDRLYVNTIDGSNWIFNGTQYSSVMVNATTPWMLAGGTNDAGGNKTGRIYRPGGAGVGSSTISPTASALFELSSTTQGFLPPRMLKAQMQAIENPSEGLVVYCSDCFPKGLQFYNGEGWISSSSTSGITPALVSDVNFTANNGLAAGTILTGTYTFTPNGSGTNASTFKWYAATDKSIPGTPVGTASTYTLTTNDLNKWIGFEVTPARSVAGSAGTPIIVWKSGITNIADKAPLTTILVYSLRKVRSAYIGPLIKVRRSSDNTSQDINADVNGNLDETALLSFVGTGTGYVEIWYDQSGFGTNASQLTTSLQPIIVNAGVIVKESSKPAISFNSQRLGFAALRNNGSNGWNLSYMLQTTAKFTSSGYFIGRKTSYNGGYGADVTTLKGLYKNNVSTYSTTGTLANTNYGNYYYKNSNLTTGSQSISYYRDGLIYQAATSYSYNIQLDYIGADNTDGTGNNFVGNISEIILSQLLPTETVKESIFWDNTNFFWLGK